MQRSRHQNWGYFCRQFYYKISRFLNRLYKILRSTLLVILSIVVLLVLLVNLTPVQRFIAQKATGILSEQLNTTVHIDHIRIDLLNHILIRGLYIEDHAGDTLLYAGEAEVRITDWFMFRRGVPVLRYAGLKNTYVHLYRTAQSPDWNYQFIIDAFDTGKKDTTVQTREPFEIDLEKITLDQVRFHMDDAWVGSDINLDVGEVMLNIKILDIKQKTLDIDEISIDGTTVYVGSYPGGKPKSTLPGAPYIDTTPFNPAMWSVSVNKLALEECIFRLEADNRPPAPDAFDPAHMDIREIALHATGITIEGDTINGSINRLMAKERSGFVLKTFRADVTVSPNASICNNLYIETNNSRLERYYAMRYTRFPDFTDYINSVRMTADLRNAVVDARDVAYFAPALGELYPAILNISGRVDGTVARLSGENLYITDGTSMVKGDITMTGLPDINNTFIDYRQGELRTSGPAILRYASSLKAHPAIALEKLSYALFQGSFTGYINRFAANGVLNTNFGVLRSNIRLLLPAGDRKPEEYEGYLSTESLNLGPLLRLPYLGPVSMYADVKGRGFDPKNAAITLRARVTQLSLKGYNYRNILAEGVLMQRNFEGKLLVDDPNLALAFDGNVDFSKQKQLRFKAQANLLQSDLHALHLTNDTLKITADFDLDCTASTLDDFTGQARLYNINMIRNEYRVDLDSVYVNAGETENGKKFITIQSNDLTASVQGYYHLSGLPYSVQHYLYGYLPNYIPAPKEEAPPQNLTFDITTREIDQTLAVMTSMLNGFSHTTLAGSLNTTTQQLSLNANIPYGNIGSIQISGMTLTGTGNYRELKVAGQADRLVIGDSALNIPLYVNATLGSDSLQFRITTSSSMQDNGSATINGQAYARGDSLHLSFLPSEFYLGNNRWDIPAGNELVFSKQYLEVNNLSLRSGLQQISAATIRNNQSINIELSNIDLSQLSMIKPLDRYDPDGRLSGTINISDIYTEPMISGELTATGVTSGTETIGKIHMAGRYNIKKKYALLQTGSGIFRGTSSLIVSGAFGIDSMNTGKVRGNLQFNSAPLAWLSPFLQDYVSNLGGTLNGVVQLRGATSSPNISGDVSLNNATVRVDYLGTSYTIPNADITIDNRRIAMQQIRLKDQYNNEAILTGSINHEHLRNFALQLRLTSEKFEVVNLKEHESHNFYGHLIAKVSSMSVTGPVDDIRMSIQATPAAASQLYLPLSSDQDVSTYSYATFKTYGSEQDKILPGKRNRFIININAMATPDLMMSMILDPATGDAINATGSGNISLEISPDKDIGIHGAYQIQEGDYTFTFRQLFFRRRFIINPGSNIIFGGSLAKTTLDVNATYRTMARLYDLLSDIEKQSQMIPSNELTDAKTPQNVDVTLFMKGSLETPNLTFKLEMPEKRSVGTYAYTKLERVNANDRELFDQVASLLLINAFIPPEGLVGTTARSGAINNMSDIISTTASSQLTGIVNKLLGDENLQIELKYKNYNLSDASTTAGGLNRNEFRFGLRQNLFNDRVIVEVGSAYDWGRPNAAGNTTSNFNLAGDFRLQFLLTEDGRIRTNLFRTSNYDVLVDKNISRAGAGISWRKTFDNLEELLRSQKYIRAKEAAEAAKDSISKSAVLRERPPL